MMAKMAPTNVTITPDIETPFLEPSGSNVKHQSLDAFNCAALPFVKRGLADIARVPGAAAHLRLPDSSRRQVVDHDGLLADHGVDHFGHAQFQLAHDVRPDEKEGGQREERE